MLLFHGTTLNRFLEAIKDGFLGTEKTIWNVSEEYTTYFYTEKFIKKECDLTDKEYIKSEGLRYALESSVFALSQERKNLKRVVLVFDSKDLSKIGKIQKDDSCGQNMDYCAKLSGKIPLNLIKEIWIDRENLDMLALYFIGLSEDRNENNRGFYIDVNPDVNNIILNCSKEVYISLCNWFMENMESVDLLEQTTIAELSNNLNGVCEN